MIFRIEARPSRSQFWPWFVRLAKECPHYSVTDDGVYKVHVVDRLSFDEALRFREVVRGWKGVRMFQDGIPISVERFRALAFAQQWNANYARSGLAGDKYRIGSCPRCAANHRLTEKTCPKCGIRVEPVDTTVNCERPALPPPGEEGAR